MLPGPIEVTPPVVDEMDYDVIALHPVGAPARLGRRRGPRRGPRPLLTPGVPPADADPFGTAALRERVLDGLGRLAGPVPRGRQRRGGPRPRQLPRPRRRRARAERRRRRRAAPARPGRLLLPTDRRHGCRWSPATPAPRSTRPAWSRSRRCAPRPSGTTTAGPTGRFGVGLRGRARRHRRAAGGLDDGRRALVGDRRRRGWWAQCRAAGRRAAAPRRPPARAAAAVRSRPTGPAPASSPRSGCRCATRTPSTWPGGCSARSTTPCCSRCPAWPRSSVTVDGADPRGRRRPAGGRSCAAPGRWTPTCCATARSRSAPAAVDGHLGAAGRRAAGARRCCTRRHPPTSRSTCPRC